MEVLDATADEALGLLYQFEQALNVCIQFSATEANMIKGALSETSKNNEESGESTATVNIFQVQKNFERMAA